MTITVWIGGSNRDKNLETCMKIMNEELVLIEDVPPCYEVVTEYSPEECKGMTQINISFEEYQRLIYAVYESTSEEPASPILEESPAWKAIKGIV